MMIFPPPGLTLFQVVNFGLILVLLILFLRYLWITFAGREGTPVEWQQAVKTGRISARLKKMERRYPDKVRFYNWWFQTERLRQERVPGVFAELGVYKGASAAALHQMDPTRPFHLFDTFTGFTAGDLMQETGEAATYTPANFSDTSIESVLKRINGSRNIVIHQGYFPDSAAGFTAKVALVNIDADLYLPTKAGLEFFYPLLSPGGVMIIHDYHYKWPGIIRAVDEFLTAVPEQLIHLPDIDGTVMIIRNK
ncbi:MAG: TylF/MycF/NovP-related O-methyltransferase [Bacteroidota bacterium]